MALTEEFFTVEEGNENQTDFQFTFEYITKDDVRVSINDVETTSYTWPNATTVRITADLSVGDRIRVFRYTNVDNLKATFYSGSSIRAKDLNDNFQQNNFAVQEIKNYTWDSEVDTVHSNEVWESSDERIATTAAMDQRFQDEATETITSTETYVDTDEAVPTALAASNQYRTIVSADTPPRTDYFVGKTWLQNDDDLTLSIWNGTGWTGVVSGGTFTTLRKVVYVDALNGNDAAEGHRISAPKRTIRAAMAQINGETDEIGDGSVIVVAPGVYGEEFPIDIQKKDISVVGQSLRNCIIHPVIGAIPATDMITEGQYRIREPGNTDFTDFGAANSDVSTVFTATGPATGTGRVEDIAVQNAYDVTVPEDNELTVMFRVNTGSYFQNLTFMGMKGAGQRGGNPLDTDVETGLPTQQGWNFAFFPEAVIRKSPYIQNCTSFSDSRINNVNFTPHTPGEGFAGDLTSDGFAGGAVLIDGSVPSVNSPLRSMVCDSFTHTSLNGPGVLVTNNGYTQVTSSYAFFNQYHMKAINGGQANLAASTSDFGNYSLIADGRSVVNIFTADCVTAVDTSGAAVTTIRVSHGTADASWHGSETRPQPNMLLAVNAGAQVYPILSSVPQDQATYDADPAAYTGDWIVTISRPDPTNRSNNLGFSADVATGTDNVQFFLRSMVASSGHTMEYVGSGTDYRALPENGGVPIEANQRIERNNGAIWTAITDHNGKFTVGDFFEVDQQLGFVTIPTGSIAFDLASDQSPELSANLDANSNRITEVADPTAAQDAATKNYVDTNFVDQTSATGAAAIPAGNNSTDRPTGVAGYIRFNTTDVTFEGYDGTAWGAIGGGGGFEVSTTPPASPSGGDTYWDSEEGNAYIYYEDGTSNQWVPLVPSTPPKSAEGGGTDEVFFLNDNAVTTNYELPTGKNALSAGPITINSGITVEIPSGQSWVIV